MISRVFFFDDTYYVQVALFNAWLPIEPEGYRPKKQKVSGRGYFHSGGESR